MKKLFFLAMFLMVILNMALANDKVLLIAAKNGFRDEELFISKEVLETNGYIVDIASSSKGECRGMLGKSITAGLSLDKVNVSDYKAVVFIGGMGAQEYFNNPVAYKIAREAYEGGKVVAAICIAPVILGRAGILANKHATVSKGFKNQFQSSGAVYTGSGVEVDGNIITADGPGSAEGFAYKILDVLKER